MPSLEYLIVNPESDLRLPIGHEGMLLVRGDSVFGGYLNYNGESPFVEFEGKKWYKTGDYVKEDKSPAIVGLMAERVTEAARKSQDAFVSPGLAMQDAPYLGGFIMEDKEMIQYIDLDLLPETFRFLPLLEGGHHVSDDD